MPRFVAHLLFYPTLCWNLLLCRLLPKRSWWNRIDDHVLLGALPFASMVPEFQALGVQAIVNTCEEYPGPREQYDEAGIEQLRIPTVDFTPPSLQDLEQAVAFIESHAARDHTVYIHCKAGRGRSATVILCWLIHTQGLTPEAAQAVVLQKRPHANRELYRREAVQQFYELRAMERS